MNRAVPSAALIAVVVLALTGCAHRATDAAGSASPTPSVSDSPTPSSTPSVAPTPGPAAAVDISATGISVVDAAGTQLKSLPYTASAADIVALLNSTFGTTETIQKGSGLCGTAIWGPNDGNLGVTAVAGADPGTNVIISDKASSVGAIRIQSSTGFAVGDDVSSVVASLPTAQVDNDRDGAVWQTGPSSTATAPEGAVVSWDESSGKKIASSLFAPTLLSTLEFCE